MAPDNGEVALVQAKEPVAQEQAVGAAVAQTYRKLGDALRRGSFPPGSRLPGERDLATSLGVSRSTLRGALGLLNDEGRLERSSQRGWFVAREVVGEPPSTLQSFSEIARARGLTAQARVLLMKERPATFEEAERLRIAPAARVVELRRLRSMDNVPICLDVSVVANAPALAALDMTDRSLYEALEQECGIRIARSSYTVRADAADEQTAELLDIDAGAPVLIGDEVAYTADETPVLAGAMAYRSDAYRFQADLFRPL
ncbi:GntR family transcriptional regulator [Streptomyces sp. AcE210]|uniref:GntR family transcriptional regulator n=1 Tax=Streptomyces sp. AcE210 TaxID=2292703 RepID=UPI001F0C1E2C|nr:GntR family transcriptional regulator [Streptomyces sp. AcE210]